MAPRKKAVDKEVLEVQEVQPITDVNDTDTDTGNPDTDTGNPDPEPEIPVDREVVRLQVEFHRVDKIMAEVETGKTIEEAILVDVKLAEIFETKDIIVRDTRNSNYHLFKKGVEPKATANVDGVWTQPVSYSIA